MTTVRSRSIEMLIHFDSIPPFDFDNFVRQHGPRRKRRMAYYLAELQKVMATAVSLITPVAVYKSFPAAALPQISQYLPGAELITIAVCTVGEPIEAQTRAIFQDDPLAGMMLDQIGAAWVKGISMALHGRIRAEARERGWKSTPAYRPGIGRWPLSLQRELFDNLPIEKIGVTLIESNMMLPTKSISIIMGQGAALSRSKFAPGRDGE